MTDSDVMVDISGLTKHFDGTAALRGVDLRIRAGSIIGLMGPNGCGKSTLLRHMIGLCLPTAGSVRTLGCEARALDPARLARIGYVHQEGGLLDWLSVSRHIDLVAAYYDAWNRRMCETFIDRFGLDGEDRIDTLSPGKRQQLAVLLAVCHEPDLLILDEPAAALDPAARLELLRLLLEIMNDRPGRTILISSHILSDVEKVIDHAIIMADGRVLLDGGLDEVRESFFRARLTGLADGEALPFGESAVVSQRREGDQAVCVLRGLSRERIVRAAGRARLGCQCEHLTLEEIYLAVVKPCGGATGRHE